MGVESLLRDWLAALCGMSPGTVRGVIVLAPGPGEPEARRLDWPAEAPDAASLATLANAALTSREPVEKWIERPGRPDGAQALQIAAPLPRILGCPATVALEIGTTKPEQAELQRERMRGAGDWLGLLLRQARSAQRLGHGLELMTRALERRRFADAAHEVATDAARRFGCERVAVGRLRGGRMQLVALSHSASFEARSARARDLLGAMEEACDQDAMIAAPLPPALAGRVAIEHERVRTVHGLRAVCSVPLVDLGEAFGALHFEWSGPGGPPDPAVLECCEDAGALLGPLLARVEAADASAFARVRRSLRDGARWLFEARQLGAKLATGALATAAVALLLAPAPHRVGADAALEGRVRRAVVAGIDGFLAEVEARPGDEVRAGQVLARLDARDLELERRSLHARREQIRSEHREARAQHDLSRVSILAAQLAQAEAELGLVDAKLGHTQLVAPFDGIVVRGDPSQQIGAPVERGEVLYELAPLDGYRIVLEVDERDVQWVREGQRGELALAAIPGEPHAMVVERVTPVASAVEGRNVFRVEAGLAEPDPTLRPGMEGVAKIEAGEARRVWLWTHAPLEWLRLWLWRWVG